jgi:hypothetical protein
VPARDDLLPGSRTDGCSVKKRSNPSPSGPRSSSSRPSHSFNKPPTLTISKRVCWAIVRMAGRCGPKRLRVGRYQGWRRGHSGPRCRREVAMSVSWWNIQYPPLCRSETISRRDHWSGRPMEGASDAYNNLFSGTRTYEGHEHRQRCKTLPPMQPGEAEHLMEAFLATRRVITCLTRYAAPSKQGSLPMRCGN